MNAKKRQRRKTRSGSAGQPLTEEMLKKIAAEVREVAEPLCAAEGVELVHVEYQRESGGRMLRVYIDRPGGIRLDDCVGISRQLSDLLDVYLEHDAAYHLEVSSPGPDRPLSVQDDFVRFKGHRAKIGTIKSIDGQKNFSGTLMGLTADRINMEIEGKSIKIPLDLVKKARLVNYHGEN